MGEQNQPTESLKKINSGFSSSKLRPCTAIGSQQDPREKGSRDPFGCGPTLPLYLVGREKLPCGYEAKPLLPFL